MAAYASAVTVRSNGAERISKSLKLVAGKIDITNYNAITTEETAITRYFKPSAQAGVEKGIISMVITPSENGYELVFNKTTGKFKSYSAVLTETADDVDLGTFDFVAIGYSN